jgi:hypothetical protein
MTYEYDWKDMKQMCEVTVRDCPWVKFHVVDLENYDEQIKEEMIHAFIVIPQWCERPRKNND